MEQRRLGKTDMVASVLGFGGSEIGYQRVSGRTVARLLGSALDAGLNVIDTAECYEDSEVLIGRALGPRRREFHLFTKCGHARGWGRADWRPAPLLASIERSLRRLETDYLDLIQLHSCSLNELRRGDAIAALERARDRGWARYIGYSGHCAALHVERAGRPHCDRRDHEAWAMAAERGAAAARRSASGRVRADPRALARGRRRVVGGTGLTQVARPKSEVIRVESSIAAISSSEGRRSKRLAASNTRGSNARSPAVLRNTPGRPRAQ